MNNDDNVLFSEGGITVSPARFVSSSGTIAMGNVSRSVTREEEEQTGIHPLVKALIAFLFVAPILGMLGALPLAFAARLVGITSESAQIVLAYGGGGVGYIAGWVACFRFLPKSSTRCRYTIWLGTSSGEFPVVNSLDRDFILRVEQAINQALEARG